MEHIVLNEHCRSVHSHLCCNARSSHSHLLLLTVTSWWILFETLSVIISYNHLLFKTRITNIFSRYTSRVTVRPPWTSWNSSCIPSSTCLISAITTMASLLDSSSASPESHAAHMAALLTKAPYVTDSKTCWHGLVYIRFFVV